MVEKAEASEAEVKGKTEIRDKLLENAVTESSAKYWGEKANDRQFGRRGVGTTLWLLESGGMEGYTREAA